MKRYMKFGITSLLLAAMASSPVFANGGHGVGGHGGYYGGHGGYYYGGHGGYYGGHGGYGWGWGGVAIGAAIIGSAAYLASTPYPYWYGYPYSYQYATPALVYVQPTYIEQQQEVAVAPAPASNMWYYCRKKHAYYPYVQSCAEGWEMVPSTPTRR